MYLGLDGSSLMAKNDSKAPAPAEPALLAGQTGGTAWVILHGWRLDRPDRGTLQACAMLVKTERHGEIAVLVIDNPPVNALSRAMRRDLAENLDAALADPKVEALVIACAGKTFVAGADISELDKPRLEPLTGTIAGKLERSAKPSVAAIFGTALGGGLELALGCHWRVAARDARLGLPEVKLGIIPGGGGTQRLPRLVGVKLALDMISGGDMISAETALAAGLVDELASGEIREAAISFAQRMLVEKRAPRRASALAVTGASEALFNAKRAEMKQKQRGYEAPLDAIKAVEESNSLPFAQGLAREYEIFEIRRQSSQSRALRHVFFARREAAKTPIDTALAGSRLRALYRREAERLLAEGAPPEAVNAAMEEFGYAAGPFTAADAAKPLTGKPVTGKQGEFPPAAIVERLVYPLVNEGALLLEEGVASRPGDLDVLLIRDFGFPDWRGGPMFYADEVGLRVVRDRLAYIARETGDANLIPAKLLERHIEEGRGFYAKS
jgi:enoyl-CoA hydratase/carnithine racemase